MKNYASSSGYAYEYRFRGGEAAAGAAEYVFDVSAGQRVAREIRLRMESAVVARWEADNRRELNGPERYGVIKARLFRAFDEAETPADLSPAVCLAGADLDEAAVFLGLL